MYRIRFKNNNARFKLRKKQKEKKMNSKMRI